jgi:hypothetical protein
VRKGVREEKGDGDGRGEKDGDKKGKGIGRAGGWKHKICCPPS